MGMGPLGVREKRSSLSKYSNISTRILPVMLPLSEEKDEYTEGRRQTSTESE
eukprot:CAMPEP_0196129816 /NCGR_PEP_ID=MMETSP0910-20130528/407_1 /TAXON_ID=49265 /ORGANISM="Thalassiosira rotula, Strain GSO102" /LENGTH=51 /DNA_ID=CAMNT_0041389009 /DNA_START=26 /DNA_END=178 /DNA_ORIENTATION=+